MKIKNFIFLLIVAIFISACEISLDFAPGELVPNENGTIDTDPNDNTPGDDENPGEVIVPPVDEYVLFSSLEEPISETQFTSNVYPEDVITLESFEIELIENNFLNTQFHELGSVYYSTTYETYYVSFKSLEGGEYLSTYDLYLIERHAIAYFQSDSNRSEDKDYLKYVLFYPDQISMCGYSEYSTISGCADYGGEYATIIINDITSMDEFLNPIMDGIYQYEPKRDTFAHEYGHVSTFYHMIYKGDASYEDYLKIRLKDKYDEVYPDGIPSRYSSSDDYYIQPEEILADDFVELFYLTDIKYEGDDPNYILNYQDMRNSLNIDATKDIAYLNENLELKNEIKGYYTSNFYYLSRTSEYFPIVIKAKNSGKINYFDSPAHLGNDDNLKTITTSGTVKLIALEAIYENGQRKYYRVIISSLIKFYNEGTTFYNKKDISNNIVYVKSLEYSEDVNESIYTIRKEITIGGESKVIDQNDLLILDSSLGLALIPFYDFSYFIGTTSGNDLTMYDYLHTGLSGSITINSGLITKLN